MWVVIRRRLGYHPLTKPRDPTRANQLGNACSTRGQDADSGVCTEYMPFTPYILCIATLALLPSVLPASPWTRSPVPRQQRQAVACTSLLRHGGSCMYVWFSGYWTCSLGRVNRLQSSISVIFVRADGCRVLIIIMAGQRAVWPRAPWASSRGLRKRPPLDW